jgi:RNA polymerase sigma-70 factor (ECF subfamily)
LEEVERAFLAAYDAHGDAIFRFCALKISDREAAHDLMQETFMKTWDYARQGNEIKDWKPFLFRTAYNLVVDTYRKKRSVSLEQLVEDHDFAVIDEQAGKEIDTVELKRARDAIDRMDATYRDVLVLRFTEDLPPREIAKILGLSENVVSVRLHRGIKMLRDRLDQKL